MKAVIYKEPCAIDHPQALADVELEDPQPESNDLLVAVEAISVNPVDYKVRASFDADGGRVLGWDAVGVVQKLGTDVTGFQVGDRVWYAGDLNRPGTNAELQCVDFRMVSKAPTSISAEKAAALPLTSITAWEILFERFALSVEKTPSQNVLLVSGGAGGVGSILIQLAARLTSATVIATAGNPESEAWVRKMGAHHVMSYKEPLKPQLDTLGLQVTHIASLTHSEAYLDQFAELIAPFGNIALIDDPPSFDIVPMKLKSISVHWELMFTKSIFGTPTLGSQGKLLDEVARLVDAGIVSSTRNESFGTINAENLKRAHEKLESGSSRGKIVLCGFE